MCRLLFEIHLKQPLFLKCGDSARLDGDGACANTLKLTPTPTGFRLFDEFGGSLILTSTVDTGMMQLASESEGRSRLRHSKSSICIHPIFAGWKISDGRCDATHELPVNKLL